MQPTESLAVRPEKRKLGATISDMIVPPRAAAGRQVSTGAIGSSGWTGAPIRARTAA